MSKKRLSFADQIRRLIETCGETPYRISKETGVDTATLSRFMNDKGGLSMPNLDALAEYLGWTISAGKPNPKKGR